VTPTIAMSRRRRAALILAAALLAGAAAARPAGAAADAPPPVDVVASFSILGDMAREVGGDRVAVRTLVGPDGDAHVYEPSPADARAVAGADLVVVNGLGFEGWLPRLLEAAGYKGPVATASEGVKARSMRDDDHHEDAHGHGDHDEEEQHAAHRHGDVDPHAWQDLRHGRVYVANIARALAAADPAGAAAYEANARAYGERLAALDREVREAVARLPEARRRIVTSHDAFGYFAEAYGLEVLAPEGVSTESEASAADVASLIRQIRREGVPAVFVENVSDPRLLQQITRETGARIGGTLYTDALSRPEGPAPSYEAMFRHNVRVLLDALATS
jgi:zinc/manganese transport system substrate-binding protein